MSCALLVSFHAVLKAFCPQFIEDIRTLFVELPLQCVDSCL